MRWSGYAGKALSPNYWYNVEKVLSLKWFQIVVNCNESSSSSKDSNHRSLMVCGCCNNAVEHKRPAGIPAFSSLPIYHIPLHLHFKDHYCKGNQIFTAVNANISQPLVVLRYWEWRSLQARKSLTTSLWGLAKTVFSLMGRFSAVMKIPNAIPILGDFCHTVRVVAALTTIYRTAQTFVHLWKFYPPAPVTQQTSTTCAHLPLHWNSELWSVMPDEKAWEPEPALRPIKRRSQLVYLRYVSTIQVCWEISTLGSDARKSFNAL